MAARYPTFFPRRINTRVPSMSFVEGVRNTGEMYLNLENPPALDADGIIAAQSISGGATFTTFADAYDTEEGLWKFGRALSLVLSTAGTPAVTVTGRDYLGAKMIEGATGNGATTVNLVKAFKYIDSIQVGSVSGVTINVGWRDVFGLPYKSIGVMVSEVKNGDAAANAGTMVEGLGDSTSSGLTTADVRGTYAPATVLPDGTNTFEIWYRVSRTNLHGNAQYAG